ncbi:toll/interleukin-1 receptor domain-containing protein [Actinosynnema sp. CS-041913]|uniref:toll/interleukin-1 receptor domain-containing protein n=1 Tax=Actinosynnema sp. CS-041913 TaxID=3239917 RepID=UPI003D89E997
MDTTARPPRRVFISYAHEDPLHIGQVGLFAELLRQFGVDARLDANHPVPGQDWAGWIRDEIDNADYIIIIASPEYRAAADGTTPGDRSRGVQTEVALLRDRLHQDRPTWTRRLLPVVLPGYRSSDIPDFLHPGTSDHYAPALIISALTISSLTPLLAVINHGQGSRNEEARVERQRDNLHGTHQPPQDTDELDARPVDGDGGVGTLVGVMIVPVSIYLGDGTGHRAVESAVENALRVSGLAVVDRDDPVIGSWFRRLRAKAVGFGRSELGATAAHAAETHLVHAQDAEVTARLMEHLASVIESLRPERNAVLRIGALLIVKVDGELSVLQLTPAQQYRLNHEPHLVQQPGALLHALAARQDDQAVEPAPVSALLDAPSPPGSTSADVE